MESPVRPQLPLDPASRVLRVRVPQPRLAVLVDAPELEERVHERVPVAEDLQRLLVRGRADVQLLVQPPVPDRLGPVLAGRGLDRRQAEHLEEQLPDLRRAAGVEVRHAGDRGAAHDLREQLGLLRLERVDHAVQPLPVHGHAGPLELVQDALRVERLVQERRVLARRAARLHVAELTDARDLRLHDVPQAVDVGGPVRQEDVARHRAEPVPALLRVGVDPPLQLAAVAPVRRVPHGALLEPERAVLAEQVLAEHRVVHHAVADVDPLLQQPLAVRDDVVPDDAGALPLEDRADLAHDEGAVVGHVGPAGVRQLEDDREALVEPHLDRADVPRRVEPVVALPLAVQADQRAAGVRRLQVLAELLRLLRGADDPVARPRVVPRRPHVDSVGQVPDDPHLADRVVDHDVRWDLVEREPVPEVLPAVQHDLPQVERREVRPPVDLQRLAAALAVRVGADVDERRPRVAAERDDHARVRARDLLAEHRLAELPVPRRRLPALGGRELDRVRRVAALRGQAGLAQQVRQHPPGPVRERAPRPAHVVARPRVHEDDVARGVPDSVDPRPSPDLRREPVEPVDLRHGVICFTGHVLLLTRCTRRFAGRPPARRPGSSRRSGRPGPRRS